MVIPLPLPEPPRLRLVREGDPTPDARLVQAARGGDRAALHKLYTRHGAYIAGMCARLLRCRDEAQEVTQDTFVRAFSQLDQLRDGDAFRPWLAQIAVRLARRHLRRQRFLRFFGVRGEEDASLDALSDGAPAEARAELRQLDEALLRLPSEQRIAWMLRHVEGEPLEQVAAACGCSLATVKRWIDAADTAVRRQTGKETP
jgi:RNA polymerase sigma-70 factor (ECF subfamily)